MSDVRINKTQGKNDESQIMRREESSSQLSPFDRWSLSPFGLMRHFTNEMDRVFRGWGNGGAETEGWPPAIDVQQCGGSMVIAAELPGLKREDVKVEVADNAVIIEGEKKREHKDDHEGYHRWERSYGHFYRAVPLPQGAKTDQVKAELKDGVLKVSVPVPESQKKLRQVPIEEGSKGAPASA
jgi:HSP20 family protein